MTNDNDRIRDATKKVSNEHPGRWKDDEYLKIYGLYITLKSTDIDNTRRTLIETQELYRNPSWGYINKLYDRVEQLERERDEADANFGVIVSRANEYKEALYNANQEIAALKARVTELEKEVEELNGAHWNSLSLADRKALIKDAGK